MVLLNPEISLLSTYVRQNIGTCAQNGMHKGICHSIIYNNENF